MLADKCSSPSSRVVTVTVADSVSVPVASGLGAEEEAAEMGRGEGICY